MLRLVSDTCRGSASSIDTISNRSRTVARFRLACVRASLVSAMGVVVLLESGELQFQVRSRPEESLIQTLSANGSDQSLGEWMGQRGIRNRFDLADLQNPQM